MPSEADLARRLAAVEDLLADMARASVLRNASIDGTNLPVYDTDGTVRQQIGQQTDGSYTITDLNGPPPVSPGAPTLDAQPGLLIVRYFGQTSDGTDWLADFARVEVHAAQSSGATPDDANQVASFVSQKGGVVSLAVSSGLWYVTLTAANTSGAESGPSVERSIVVPAAILSNGITTYSSDLEPTGLGADDEGSIWYDTANDNEPYRWSGTAWVTVRDATIAVAKQVADQAQADALSAGSAATAAQSDATSAAQAAAAAQQDATDAAGAAAGAQGDADAAAAAATQAQTDADAAKQAAADAATVANSKTRSYFQDTAPASPSDGDVWYDTNDGFHPSRWNATTSTWDDVQDQDVVAAAAAAATADQKATQAQTDAATADSKAVQAQSDADAAATAASAADSKAVTAQQTADTAKSNAATADAKAVTAQSTADTAKANAATADAKAVAAQGDADAAAQAASDAQADATAAAQVADSKSRTYFQTTAPTSPSDGDVWYDTDDAYRPRRWNASLATPAWEDVRDQAVLDAAAAASAADSKAVAAQQAADQAATDAATADAKAVQAQSDADAANSAAAAADAKAVTAQGAADQAATDAATADSKAVTAQTAADQAKTAASTADAKAVAAQTDADTAQAAADAADNRAADAATLAGTKNRTFFQTTAPANPVDGDVWYDTDDGFKPARWSSTTSTWENVQDQAIIAASQAAATADSKAVAAQTDADAADAKAVAAQSDADAASTAASTADAKAVQAQTDANTAKTNAATADQKAVAAQSTADTAKTNAATADAKAVQAQTDADSAAAAASTADQKAVAAQSDADAAASAASAAQTDADAAANLAGTKNRTWFQTTAPANPTSGDVWYDTDDKYRPRRWNASLATPAWEDVRDQAILDAANAASTADSKAVAAQTAADQAATDAATADGKAVTAQGAADQAATDAANADAKAVAAQSAADTAKAAADAADQKAVAAQGTADTAKTNAATADAKAVQAQTDADTAKTNAATADAKAVTAQTAADTAQAAADAADDRAAAAAAVAASKNETFFQDAQPASTNDGDVWYDTNDGFRPRRYNSGTATWVDVQDQAIIAAANAASAADAKAVQAQSDADAADAAAVAAQSDADAAATAASTADGKAVAAQNTADQAKTDAATADGKAVAAQSTADTAKANAATADAKAVTATNNAATAQQAADAAQARADTVRLMGSNMVYDGGFENGDDGKSLANGGGTSIVTTVNDGTAHGGSLYFSMTRNSTSPSYPGALFPVSFQKDRKYTVELWARVPATAPASQDVYVRVNFKKADGTNLWPTTVQTIPNDNTWRKYTYSFNTEGDCVNLDTTLWIQHNGALGPDTPIHVDDVAVYDVTDALAAQAAADTAQAAADAAQSVADQATQDAAAADAKAVAAQSDADAAATAAATADQKAVAAQSTADTAKTNAATADAKAVQAQTDANTAKTNAATADSKAVAAQSAADAAQAAADAADNAAADAAALAGTKNRTFFQPAAPANPVDGDVWYDTDAGYKPSRWNATTAAWENVQDQAIIDAANAAAAADSKAVQAQTDADAADAKAVAAQSDADAAATAASTADGKAVTAQNTADTAKANAATADQKAVAAQSTADTAKANAATADQKAVTAQGAADTAKSAADAAQADADAAAGLAGTKNRTWFQIDQPTGATDGDVWYDTDDGFHPRRLNSAGVWEDVRDATILSAANAAAAADAKAVTAKNAADAAQADADTADAKAVTAQNAADAAKSAADAADAKAVTAQGAADAAQSAAATADSKAVAAQSTADTAKTNAATADAKAVTATNDAATAQAAADAADDAAAAAAATANSKSKTWFQTTQPTGASNGDVWYDTDDQYRPRRYNTSLATPAWEDVRDQSILDAASAAADADAKAVAAQNKADQATSDAAAADAAAATAQSAADAAQTAANTAQTAAQNAQDTANQALSDAATAKGIADGKITTFVAADTAVPVATGDGDLWVVTNKGNELRRWTGSAWVSIKDTGIAQAIAAASTADGKAVTAQNTATQASIDALSSSPIYAKDSAGSGKWLRVRYAVAQANTVAPTLTQIAGAAVLDRVLVSDGANLAQALGENYVGQVRTLVTVAAATTLAFTFSHDDGCTIYVDGVVAYTKNVVGSGASFSYNLSAGQHLIDMLWTEATGADGIFSITPTIGSQVDTLNAPRSADVGPLLTVQAQSTAQTAVTNAATAKTAADTAKAAADAAQADADAADQKALDAANIAAGKGKVYAQPAAPAGDANGLWIDTDNGNLAHTWNGSTWVATQDAGIQAAANAAATADGKAATAQTAANTAQTAADTAKTAADTAQSTADGKVVTFSLPSTTPPTAEGTGDLWIVTDDGNKLKRWDGSAWVLVQDSGIPQALTDASNAASAADQAASDAAAADQAAATAQQAADAAAAAAQAAQSTADGKIVTFFGPSAPVADGVGDLWIDTDNDNRISRWDGSNWLPAPAGTNAINVAGIEPRNLQLGGTGGGIYDNLVADMQFAEPERRASRVAQAENSNGAWSFRQSANITPAAVANIGTAGVSLTQAQGAFTAPSGWHFEYTDPTTDGTSDHGPNSWVRLVQDTPGTLPSGLVLCSTTASIPVTANETYTAEAAALVEIWDGTSGTWWNSDVKAQIRWLNSSGATISTNIGESSFYNYENSTRMQPHDGAFVTALAPAGAVSAKIELVNAQNWSTNPVAGTPWRVYLGRNGTAPVERNGWAMWNDTSEVWPDEWMLEAAPSGLVYDADRAPFDKYGDSSWYSQITLAKDVQLPRGAIVWFEVLTSFNRALTDWADADAAGSPTGNYQGIGLVYKYPDGSVAPPGLGANWDSYDYFTGTDPQQWSTQYATKRMQREVTVDIVAWISGRSDTAPANARARFRFPSFGIIGYNNSAGRQQIVSPENIQYLNEKGLVDLQLWAGERGTQAAYDNILKGASWIFADSGESSNPDPTYTGDTVYDASDRDEWESFHWYTGSDPNSPGTDAGDYNLRHHLRVNANANSAAETTAHPEAYNNAGTDTDGLDILAGRNPDFTPKAKIRLSGGGTSPLELEGPGGVKVIGDLAVTGSVAGVDVGGLDTRLDTTEAIRADRAMYLSNAQLTVGTTSVLVPGLRHTFTSPGTSAEWDVNAVIDAQMSAAGSTFVGDLYVDGAPQSSSSILAGPSTPFRSTCAAQWVVTGLAAGSHTIEVRAKKTSTAGGWVTQASHTTMRVKRVA